MPQLDKYFPYIIVVVLTVCAFFITLALVMRKKKTEKPVGPVPTPESGKPFLSQVDPPPDLPSDPTTVLAEKEQLIEFRLSQIARVESQNDSILEQIHSTDAKLDSLYKLMSTYGDLALKIANTPLTRVMEKSQVEDSPLEETTVETLEPIQGEAQPEVIETRPEPPVVEQKVLKCFRCNNKWIQRGDKKPKHCPKCHSMTWNKRVKK